ncbi:rho guanine nucleotide exchange factor 19 [Cyprinodon tularosa]|uniref:rho guanine nucleotide exchange factor 19 n=1 Tax=Cyprinodon tularosa TaxID=77115 RepID=UPI0018E28613|nr:rho guanine nucleotide exchange factor 19 [Cyprinodon tularosa]
MDFSHPRERKASSYGFIPDIIAYLGSDSEPGYDIPSETSNLKNEFLGSGDNTDHPKDYSPPIDLSAAMIPTPLEQKWDLQSPDGLEERFFLDLEARLGESVMIFQVGDIVLLHCGNFQRQYVPYLTNMMFQESLVNQLLQENKDFMYALKRLEDDPVCQKRRLKSFLVLPFQRITRIKLLLEGILKLTEPNSEAASNLTKAIKGIHEILVECDQKVEKMKSLEELVRLEMLLDFADIKSVPLVKSTRVLIHHGPLATLGSYGSKMSINRIYLHLFNDLLLISSKKYERFTVLDYALFPQHVNVVQSKVVGLPPESFLLMLSESQMGPLTTMILIANGSFDKEEWIKALSKK